MLLTKVTTLILNFDMLKEEAAKFYIWHNQENMRVKRLLILFDSSSKDFPSLLEEKVDKHCNTALATSVPCPYRVVSWTSVCPDEFILNDCASFIKPGDYMILRRFLNNTEVDSLLGPEPALALAELHDEVCLCEAVYAGQLAAGLGLATLLLQER